jgi:D-amino peptidase
MRIYISADIEGITGVVHTAQSAWPGGDYERARRWMAKDVNAAIEGALEAGATKIVVNDAHGDMRNLIIDDLHPAAQLISGAPKHTAMLHRIEDGFDLVFFIGYHTRTGNRFGIINHTYSGSVVSELKLNGQVAGEIGLNAAMAGELGVPVGLVTGDLATAQEARELLGEVETVAVKEGTGRYVALCKHPNAAREEIRAAASSALKRPSSFKPYVLAPPIDLQLRFPRTPMADACELIPEVERVDDLAVAYQAKDMREAYKLLQAFIALAHASRPSPP